MRKAFALRLLVLALLFGICSVSAYGDPTVFSVGGDAVREVVLDGTKSLIAQAGGVMPIPEPSTWVLLGTGLSVLGSKVRRRFRK
jgi:hypothetical protein